MEHKELPFDIDLHKALSDETRVKVFSILLKSGPLNVSEITKKTGVHIANVSRHLAQLHRARLVTKTRNGSERIYQANIEYLRRSLNELQSALPSADA